MKTSLAIAAGFALGLFVARLAINPSSCCKRVSAGVRDRVGEELGPIAQATGDVLGLWDYAPGLLDFLGVQ